MRPRCIQSIRICILGENTAGRSDNWTGAHSDLTLFTLDCQLYTSASCFSLSRDPLWASMRRTTWRFMLFPMSSCSSVIVVWKKTISDVDDTKCHPLVLEFDSSRPHCAKQISWCLFTGRCSHEALLEKVAVHVDSGVHLIAQLNERQMRTDLVPVFLDRCMSR
jgi:hypothetical protein